MNLEEMEPAKKPAAKKDLTVLSIEELHDYIATLRAEIERTEAAIAAKEPATIRGKLARALGYYSQPCGCLVLQWWCP